MLHLLGHHGWKQDILELEKVQCRAVRFVHNNYWPLASGTQMTSALGWEILEARRQKSRLWILFKTINGIIIVPFDHYKPQTSITISTRSSHDTNLSHTLALQELMYRNIPFSRDNPPLELFAYTGRHIHTSAHLYNSFSHNLSR